LHGKLRNNFLILLAQKEIGISQPTVSRWMRNEVTKFEEPVMRSICEYFECNIGDLLYFEPDQE
jgi:DNA-binding Xre family transcriptional regulator